MFPTSGDSLARSKPHRQKGKGRGRENIICYVTKRKKKKKGKKKLAPSGGVMIVLQYLRETKEDHSRLREKGEETRCQERVDERKYVKRVKLPKVCLLDIASPHTGKEH